jgi:hypothetical protein
VAIFFSGTKFCYDIANNIGNISKEKLGKLSEPVARFVTVALTIKVLTLGGILWTGYHLAKTALGIFNRVTSFDSRAIVKTVFLTGLLVTDMVVFLSPRVLHYAIAFFIALPPSEMFACYKAFTKL